MKPVPAASTLIRVSPGAGFWNGRLFGRFEDLRTAKPIYIYVVPWHAVTIPVGSADVTALKCRIRSDFITPIRALTDPARRQGAATRLSACSDLAATPAVWKRRHVRCAGSPRSRQGRLRPGARAASPFALPNQEGRSAMCY